MRAGELRYRVRLEQPVEAVSATGSRSVTWQLVREVAAEQAPDKGQEGMNNDALRAVRTVIWRIRWAPDLRDNLTAKWRIVYGTQVYNILACDPQGRGGRKQMMELQCRIGEDNG